MKLFYCKSCSDVVRLKKTLKKCDCGKSWGRYLDNINAEIGGNAIALGFSNSSFVEALSSNPSPERGTRFEAFVISKKANSITFKK